MEMSIQHRNRIAKEVRILSEKTSQARVAHQAKVSTAVISHVVRGNWETLSNEIFRTIEVNLKMDFAWQSAEIKNFQLLTLLLSNAQNNGISIAISEQAGRGKTHTYRRYAHGNDNVIHLECQNSWSKKSYMKHLMSAAQLSGIGTTEELVQRFIKHLKTSERPLVIIDQFDKLKDSQMDLFMDFYNELDGYCGFVLSGVRALEKRIMNGVNRDKIGYAELYSRIRRKFIRLDPITRDCVKRVCVSNQITDPGQIDYIFHNSEGDLRRVKADIEIFQQQNAVNIDLNEVEVVAG